MIQLYNGTPPNWTTGNYNYWTANGASEEDPATGSFPLKNTPELTAKTQIFPAAGARLASGDTALVGTDSFFNLSTPLSSTHGYVFSFYPTVCVSVRTDSWATLIYGKSIRCVRP